MPSPLDELRQLNVKKQRENTAKAEERDADEAASDITSNTETNITSNIVSPSDDLLTDRQVSQQTVKPYDLSASQSEGLPVGGRTDLPASQPSDRQADKPASRPPDVRSRLKDISSSSMTPVTLKLPEGINAYVDEYIHDNWKQKIKKQDIIKRAMLLAIYELETGKELVKLDG